MLSSLITQIQALCHQLARRLGRRIATSPCSPSLPVGSPVRDGDHSRGGVLELKFRKDQVKVLDTQSVWIRVDTKELIARLLANPDINLDALQGISAQDRAAESAGSVHADWHGKIRQVTQAPPAMLVRGGKRRPPPPSWH